MSRIYTAGFHVLYLPAEFTMLKVTSPVFENTGLIPLQYTFDGANISPSLDIADIPPGTKSLAVVMEDLDGLGGPMVHWLAWNIPVLKHLREAQAIEHVGLNDFHVRTYKGPCPYVGTHRYRFSVYTLDSLLELTRGAKLEELQRAMAGHILGFGFVTGLYKRK